MSQYVISGATGNIGRVIVEKLLDAGHSVKAMGRNTNKLKPLLDKGAETCTGNLDDASFLTLTFEKADGIFCMIPPNFQSNDYLAFQHNMAKSYITAIKNANVKNVVVLSSIGAHLSTGSGIVKGLHDFEESIANLKDVNVLILRPSYFMENIYLQLDIIKNMGIIGSPIQADVSQPIVATKDIANVAAKRLSSLDFKGHTIEYILGERNLSYNQITEIIGKAIDKNDLKYVTFPYEDAQKAMVQMGLSDNVAGLLIGLSQGINNGDVLNHYKRTPNNTTETSIEEFAKDFSYAFKQKNV